MSEIRALKMLKQLIYIIWQDERGEQKGKNFLVLAEILYEMCSEKQKLISIKKIKY